MLGVPIVSCTGRLKREPSKVEVLSLISKFSIVLFRTARRIYYTFKCGLHYVTMFRRFQRIIFACLTKDFFHAEAISYIAMVKVFLDFPVLFCVYFIKFEVVILQSFLFTFFIQILKNHNNL